MWDLVQWCFHDTSASEVELITWLTNDLPDWNMNQTDRNGIYILAKKTAAPPLLVVSLFSASCFYSR